MAGRLSDVLDKQSVRKLLGQKHSSFDLISLLEAGKVVLIDLSQAVFGTEGTRIIGSLLLAEVGAHALRRATSSHCPDIFIYMDEAPLFVTSSLAKLLSETRKYKVYFTLAAQYRHRLGTAQGLHPGQYRLEGCWHVQPKGHG